MTFNAVDMTFNEKTPLLKNAPKASQAMRRHNLHTFKVDVKWKGLEKNMPRDLKMAGVMTESEYREIEEIIVQTFREFRREANRKYILFLLSYLFPPSWLCCVPCKQIGKNWQFNNPVESDLFDDVMTKLDKQYEEKGLTFKMVWTHRAISTGILRGRFFEIGWRMEVQALLDE